MIEPISPKDINRLKQKQIPNNIIKIIMVLLYLMS